MAVPAVKLILLRCFPGCPGCLGENARIYSEAHCSAVRVAEKTVDVYQHLLFLLKKYSNRSGVSFMHSKPLVAHIIRGFLQPTETFVASQINSLKKYNSIVLCHHQIPNSINTYCDKYSAKELLPWLPGFWDNINYRFVKRLPVVSVSILADIAKENKVDLLHFHYLVDARFFLKLKQMTGLPAIVSVYGYDVSLFPNSFMGYGKSYIKPIFNKMECFTAMSKDMKKDIIKLGCPEQKIKVHYYGINTNRFKYPGRDYPEKKKINILMCGTLEPKKAQDQVLKALKRWEKRKPSGYSFKISFMGDGPLRKKLASIVDSFGWQNRVRFLGHVPHDSFRLVEEYRNADIFTLPSVTTNKGAKEGIPGTIVEAMTNGLPVVSTYHAGIPELINDSIDGLLVRENDIKGLSAALGELIENREMRERLGKKAAQTAMTKCQLKIKTAELEQIYDELIQKK